MPFYATRSTAPTRIFSFIAVLKIEPLTDFRDAIAAEEEKGAPRSGTDLTGATGKWAYIANRSLVTGRFLDRKQLQILLFEEDSRKIRWLSASGRIAQFLDLPGN